MAQRRRGRDDFDDAYLADDERALLGRSPSSSPGKSSSIPPRRLSVYSSLTTLLLDSWWSQVIGESTADAAIYAYCVLSGLSREDAVAVVSEGRGAASSDLILYRLQAEAAPIFRRAMIAGGVNEFMISRVIREIMDDPLQSASDRLSAVKLAGQFLGKLQDPTKDINVTITEKTSTSKDQARDLVSSQIKESLTGFSSGLQITSTPRPPAPSPPLPTPALPLGSESAEPGALAQQEGPGSRGSAVRLSVQRMLQGDISRRQLHTPAEKAAMYQRLLEGRQRAAERRAAEEEQLLEIKRKAEGWSMFTPPEAVKDTRDDLPNPEE